MLSEAVDRYRLLSGTRVQGRDIGSGCRDCLGGQRILLCTHVCTSATLILSATNQHCLPLSPTQFSSLIPGTAILSLFPSSLLASTPFQSLLYLQKFPTWPKFRPACYFSLLTPLFFWTWPQSRPVLPKYQISGTPIYTFFQPGLNLGQMLQFSVWHTLFLSSL